MTSFPRLTDKQLMVLEILSTASKTKGIIDVNIADRLTYKIDIGYSQAKAALPPLLGSLRSQGLIKRETARSFLGDKKLAYGFWSITDYGKKVLGVNDD